MSWAYRGRRVSYRHQQAGGSSGYLSTEEELFEVRKNLETILNTVESTCSPDSIKLMERAAWKTWEEAKRIAADIRDYINKNNRCSRFQAQLISNLCSLYDVATLPAIENWASTYKNSEEMKLNFSRCCEYYLRLYENMYYKNITGKYTADPENFIPSRKEYELICENKFTKKILEAYKQKPKFSAGDIVKIKKSALRLFPSDYFEAKILILKNDLLITSAVKSGARKYLCYVITNSNTCQREIEERYLQKDKKR
jgi:hypothetical protein